MKDGVLFNDSTKWSCTKNKGRDKNLCGICGQKMTDGTNATEFNVSWAYQIEDMDFRCQMAVKCNTKVLDRVRHGNRCTTYSYKVWEGKRERDLDFWPEDMIIASVLSSFSLSLFNVSQDFMSSIHFCIERKRSGIWWGGADFWSWESSAYEWWRTECFSITVERGAVQRTKRTGPRTDPCGTLKEMGAGSDV